MSPTTPLCIQFLRVKGLPTLCVKSSPGRSSATSAESCLTFVSRATTYLEVCEASKYITDKHAYPEGYFFRSTASGDYITRKK